VVIAQPSLMHAVSGTGDRPPPMEMTNVGDMPM
jgi:hypothetical protein